MQIECPLDFAMTEEHIWLVGHTHHMEIKEKNGILVWHCSAICKPDEWSFRKGFFSKNRITSFILDKERGLSETYYIDI